MPGRSRGGNLVSQKVLRPPPPRLGGLDHFHAYVWSAIIVQDLVVLARSVPKLTSTAVDLPAAEGYSESDATGAGLAGGSTCATRANRHRRRSDKPAYVARARARPMASVNVMRSSGSGVDRHCSIKSSTIALRKLPSRPASLLAATSLSNILLSAS